MDFWDLTNRQDWSACESVQRGLSSPHAVPGPLLAEDAVYQYVTMVARGYLGQTPAGQRREPSGLRLAGGRGGRAAPAGRPGGALGLLGAVAWRREHQPTSP